MPMPRDDNNQPVQCLLPLRSHVADGLDVVIGPFLDDTVAVEISTAAPCRIEMTTTAEPLGRDPAVYLLDRFYYVYATDGRRFLHLTYPDAGDTVVVTELAG